MSIINSQPLIGASGNQGYNIQRSLRFRSSASAYLNRTATSTVTDNKKLTVSYWVKRGRLSTYTTSQIIMYSSGGDRIWFDVQAADTLSYYTPANYANVTGLFRDPSAWYHIVMAIDTTQATAANRVKVYVNGSERTVTGAYPTLNQAIPLNTASQSLFIGSDGSGSYFDGYLAEINFIDGQTLTPSSFGQTNPATGVWQPIKYSGTYGTNGFYLNFSDNSNNTATTIGKDYSGNGNNWTPNNISVTSGATYDSMTDVPTLTSATAANYCVLNPLKNALTLSSANLNWVGISSGQKNAFSSIAVTSGKWYFEANLTNTSVTGNWGVGLCNDLNASNTSILGNTANGWVLYTGGGGANLRKYNNSVDVQIYSAASSIGATIGVAFDIDAGKIWFSRNNVWLEGDPSAGTTPSYSNLTGTVQAFVYGYDSNDQGSINFGQRPFAYTPPTGFVALNTFNLPTPTIGATASSQAGKYFNPVLYTGNSSGASVTGVGFAPEFIWTKSRSNTTNHELNDIVRGGSSTLFSNVTNAEATQLRISTFGSDGWTYTTDSNSANTGYTYVGWCWKANGSGSTNTSGSITSTVSANTTAGFSIVTYTGNGTQPSTVGHGLGVAPSMVIVKTRNSALYDWNCYHISLGNTQYIALNTTAAASSAVSLWNNTTPTSTVFTVNHVAVNTSSNTYVAYCFAQVAGYSAFGSYTGNGSSDGTFVYTGFRPRFIMIKRTDSTANWRILDTARDTYNVEQSELYPNLSNAEGTFSSLDGLSNGFKIRNSDAAYNASGGTYIYMAFAENPFKYSLAR